MFDFKTFTDEQALRDAIKADRAIQFPEPTPPNPPVLTRPQLVQLENSKTRIWVEVRELTSGYNVAYLALCTNGDVTNAKIDADEACILIHELERGVSDLARALEYQEAYKKYREQMGSWQENNRNAESAQVREWRAFMRGTEPTTKEPQDYDEDYDYEEDDDN